MGKNSFQISEHFNATAKTIYNAWLNSKLHSEMTGGEAICSHQVGGSFTAWDGYISGKNLHLSTHHKIIQSWRTTEFKESDEDSILEIVFKNVADGVEVTLFHSFIPEGQTSYKQGWVEHYFTPMKSYFKPN